MPSGIFQLYFNVQILKRASGLQNEVEGWLRVYERNTLLENIPITEDGTISLMVSALNGMEGIRYEVWSDISNSIACR